MHNCNEDTLFEVRYIILFKFWHMYHYILPTSWPIRVHLSDCFSCLVPWGEKYSVTPLA